MKVPFRLNAGFAFLQHAQGKLKHDPESFRSLVNHWVCLILLEHALNDVEGKPKRKLPEGAYL